MALGKDRKDPWEESVSIQAKASALGFDWPDAHGVIEKILEEAEEIREALAEGDAEHAGRELGDLLLAAVNLSRFLGISPSEALDGANQRFTDRFQKVVSQADEAGLDMRSCSLDELDGLWERAKSHGSK